jgi:predicted ATPase
MLTKLHLKQFKNFKDASLALGQLTILVGTNASGKSNVRDACRFLHGIGRGYRLAEIIGEKWGEGGVLQWRGIRGGIREAAYYHGRSFSLTAEFAFDRLSQVVYSIEVEPEAETLGARVVRESLYSGGSMLFDSHPTENPPEQSDLKHIAVRIMPGGRDKKWPVRRVIADQPVLSQIGNEIRARRDSGAETMRDVVGGVMQALESMRFLDLHPEAMRSPSFPGQTVLGDRGENLSSVLQAIHEDSRQRRALIQWLRELTPMDVEDLDFSPDQVGRVLVTLVEREGRRTSIYSASDGTLRFLAMLAALLAPDPAELYFFEELENGIHPTRLYLLLQFIEQRVSRGRIQVVGTTHSPQLLRFVSPDNLAYAALVYRLPDQPDARIARIVDLPTARDVIERQDVGRLFESGWLEDAVAFREDKDVAIPDDMEIPV